MNFLTPTIAIIAGSIALPTLLILYFLKLRRKKVEISTTLLWKKAVQDMQANAPFQRLRRNILLILQLIALAAIIAAIAQPLREEKRSTGQKHVILIDRSGSMAALDGSGTVPNDATTTSVTRLDEAKRQAIALIDSLPEGSQFVATSASDQAMVIAFDTSAEPLVPFTSNKRELKQAIESIQPVHTESALRLAVTTALANLPKRVLQETGQTIEGLQGGEPITLHLYSDGRLPDASQAKPGIENTFQFHAIGSEQATNASIVQLQAERDYIEPSKLSIFVGLQSTYTSERAVDVELAVNGQVARIQTVTLPAMKVGDTTKSVVDVVAENRAKELAEATGSKPEEALSAQASTTPGSSGTVFKLDDADGMMVSVSLRSPSSGLRMADDVLESDDRASLMVPPARRLSVAVVGRKNLFLKDALEGLPLAKLDFVSVDEFDKAYASGQAGQWDVVILDGVMPTVATAKVQQTPAAGTATLDEGKPAAEQPANQPAGTAPTNAAVPAGPSQSVTTLPLGNFIVFGQVPGGLGISERSETSQASIVDWSKEHPVTSRVLLDSLQIAKIREVRVEPGRGVEVLATAERGPAILEINKDDTHAIIVPFDYMESNWPFSQWFVAFVGLSLDYLGSEVTGSIDARGLGAQSELKDRVPMGATDVKLRHPDGTQASIELDPNGSFVYRLPPQLGVYELTWKGQPLGGDEVRTDGTVMRKYAANLLSPEESFVPTAKSISLASEVVQGQGPSGSAITMRELWPYALMFVLLVLMVEWYIYNKKVQI